jgi:hypothetical protein
MGGLRRPFRPAPRGIVARRPRAAEPFHERVDQRNRTGAGRRAIDFDGTSANSHWFMLGGTHLMAGNLAGGNGDR